MSLDRIKIDLRRVTDIDVADLKVDMSPPSRRRIGDQPGTVLKAAAELIPGSTGGLIRSTLDVPGGSRPSLAVLGSPTTYAAPATSSHFTGALGITGSAAAVIGVSAGAGIYASSLPEWGFYGTAGGGWWTNVTASAGLEFTWIFGPPSAFAGASWGVGANFSIGPAGTGPGVSVGGLMLFTMPPVRLLGFSVSGTFGWSTIPFDITVQSAYTWTHAM